MQPVKMYTTAVCPYCIRAKQILKAKGVEQIEEIRVDLDPEARSHMMEVTGRRTVPQIFIGDTHVGGHDDLVALDGRGGLMPCSAPERRAGRALHNAAPGAARCGNAMSPAGFVLPAPFPRFRIERTTSCPKKIPCSRSSACI